MSFVRFLTTNWTWLLAGFLLSFSSSYGQTFFIAIFAGEIRADFGLSHGQWGGIYTLGTTASAVAMIWMGGLTDRFRARQLGMITMLGLALACLAMAALPGAWVWGLAAVIFALRFAGQGMMSHIAIVAMARWFVATRGRALSIASMGFSLGQAILPLLFVSFLLMMDWRMAWVVAAGLVLVTIPATNLLLRKERTPQSIAESSQVAGMAGQHWTRSQALRHPLFWLMIPLMIGPPAWGTALFFQQVHIAEVKGWSLAEFVSLLPVYTLATIVFTFASGWAIDRFGTGRLVPWYMLPFAVGFTVISYADGIGLAAVGMAFFGAGSGVQATLPGAFWAEYYGTRHIGAIKAAAAAVMVFGSAIGPGISGVLIDQGIDFPAQMIGIAVYFLLAALCGAIAIRMVRPTLAVAP